MNIFLLALGGGIGAISRYLAGRLLMSWDKKPTIPIAMLIVNLIGSIGLGFFLGIRYQMVPLGAYEEPVYLFFAIGFFGAFTTFSTFSMEVRELVQKKQYKGMSLYVILSIIGSILLLISGLVIGAIV